MQEGGLIQERYILETRLGTGGMAEVWCALDQRLERRVAIKFLAPRLTEDPEFLVRFFNEAQSVARISHPNVVSVLDFGEADGSPFLVMEYVSGGALAGITGEPIQPERAVEIVRDAALGAGAAHELGIVHRDIKPANILLDEDGRATVADFGIARSSVSEKLTGTGQVIGSPHYLAPEQAAGKGSQAESDVYALGVVLYELLTGRPPFEAENATAIAIAHVERQPEPPSARGVEIEPALEALVMRTLEKEPAARFSDGTALAAALNDLEAGSFEPVAPVTRVEEVAQPSRGPRVTAAAVLIAALLLGAGAWALTRGGTGTERSVAADLDGVGAKSRTRPTAESTPTEEGYEEAVAATPTPRPTEDDDDTGEERSTERVASNDHQSEQDDTTYRNYEEDPTPTPTPSPAAEETTEPTPEPTDAPEEQTDEPGDDPG